MTTKDQKAREEEDAKTEELPQEIQDAIFSGPAVYSNRIFLTLSPLGARITFTEQREGGPLIFRTAAYLNILDLIQLKDLLNTQFEKLSISLETAARPDGEE